MNALIPHKDALFILNKFQKDFISCYNLKCTKSSDYLIPDYPLWIFYENCSFRDIKCFTIKNINYSQKEIFFTAELIKNDSTSEVLPDLLFAQLLPGSKSCINKEFIKECIEYSLSKNKINLPIIQKIFRTGKVELKNNLWKLMDEQWIKCKS